MNEDLYEYSGHVRVLRWLASKAFLAMTDHLKDKNIQVLTLATEDGFLKSTINFEVLCSFQEATALQNWIATELPKSVNLNFK